MAAGCLEAEEDTSFCSIRPDIVWLIWDVKCPFQDVASVCVDAILVGSTPNFYRRIRAFCISLLLEFCWLAD